MPQYRHWYGWPGGSPGRFLLSIHAYPYFLVFFLFRPRHDAAAALDAFLLELLQAHVLCIFYFAVCIEPFDLESFTQTIDTFALAVERHIAACTISGDQALADAAG